MKIAFFDAKSYDLPGFQKYTEGTDLEIKYFDNPYKVAIIATVDEDGDIHMFNASTLMNKGDNQYLRLICWQGEFQLRDKVLPGGG